ncbi:uncharacterized protein BJX67DRAFT_41490 [Aspergillus lucknowensis]|uniref:Uncharacterized protein n=1 Tax=Aspergillus lucknowensis TaxID=176173 RepID=A0ABR4LVB0_9EURO
MEERARQRRNGVKKFVTCSECCRNAAGEFQAAAPRGSCKAQPRVLIRCRLGTPESKSPFWDQFMESCFKRSSGAKSVLYPVKCGVRLCGNVTHHRNGLGSPPVETPYQLGFGSWALSHVARCPPSSLLLVPRISSPDVVSCVPSSAKTAVFGHVPSEPES